MKLRMILIVVASLSAAQSCIIENRENCPAYLTLDFSLTPEEVGHIHLILRHENGGIFQDTVYRERFMSPYEIQVTRGCVTLAAFGNVRDMIFENGYTVETGNAADNLYTCFLQSEYNGDLERDTVTVMKNNIGLFIRMLSGAPDTDSISVCIESRSTGYDLQGNILEGVFSHRPEAVHLPEEGAAYFEFNSRIVRQKDEDLILSVFNGTDISDILLARIQLIPILKEAGIDMDDEHLDDVYMTVDCNRMTITVSPVGWYANGHAEITF